MAQQTQLPPLHNLYIYTNEECNLACRHCWITARRRLSVSQPVVALDQYTELIDQALPLGLSYLKISGGEALLRKATVLGLLEHAYSRRLTTRLETNGTLIDEECAQVLGRTGTQVSVSLDGSTPELHEAMRLVPGCYEDTLAGLKRLRRHRVPVEIVLSLYRKNQSDIDAVIELVRSLELPKARLKLNPVMTSGRGRFMEERGELLTAAELQQFIRGLEQKYASSEIPVLVTAEPAYHSLGYILAGRVQGGRCGFLNLLGILANGSISFCGMGYTHSEYVFGRLGEVDLEDLWARHRGLEKVRAQVPDQLEGVCSNCVFKLNCQGSCRSHAFDVYGSITAPSPGCQALYDAGLFPERRLIDPLAGSSYSRDV